jgi:uncharacterized protein involved in tolerance to divalent cations
VKFWDFFWDTQWKNHGNLMVVFNTAVAKQVFGKKVTFTCWKHFHIVTCYYIWNGCTSINTKKHVIVKFSQYIKTCSHLYNFIPSSRNYNGIGMIWWETNTRHPVTVTIVLRQKSYMLYNKLLYIYFMTGKLLYQQISGQARYTSTEETRPLHNTIRWNSLNTYTLLNRINVL